MKKELFALANKNRNKLKYKTMKPPLQKDFITANTIIKDKPIKPSESPPNGYLSPLINTGKEIVIKNTPLEDKYFKPSPPSSENIILSGSNYNKMVPEVGVIVKQDNQSKNGGLNFHNQFGKMSVKEYEQLRAMYMNSNSSNTNSHIHHSPNNASQYSNSNHVIVSDEVSNDYHKSNFANANNHYQNNNNSYAAKYLVKRARTDDIMVNSGNIALYNWNDQPFNSNNYNASTRGILNEDLFKGRKVNQLKTNPKRNSVPHSMYSYSLPINFNYYSSNTNSNSISTVNSVPLRKVSPQNSRSRRKF